MPSATETAPLETTNPDGIYPFPAGMQSREIETNGAKIHVRVGGHGPAVVMLHGFGTTGGMWGHLASALIEDHTVVAPDWVGWASCPSLMAATTRSCRHPPRARESMGGDRCAAARHRPLGSDHTGSD